MRPGLILSLLLTVGAVAHAQPDDPGLRNRVRDRVRVAIEQKLIAVLALDAQTAARFTQVLDKYDSQIADLQRDQGLTHRDLKQYVDAGGNDATTINRLADRMLDDRGKIHQLESQRSQEVRRVLSPQQYGKMMIVYPEVAKEIKQELWKALAEKRAQKRGGGPSPVEVPPDWQ